MFFGEYLIVKKVINEDQLLDALTYQIENLPSFMRVLRESKIISSEDLFKMIKIQLETHSDLIEVLRDEQKIDENQLHQLFVKQSSDRKMLGEVLVELKITDQSTVEKNLYDFLRDKDNLKKIMQEEQEASVKTVAKDIAISDAALESLRELGMGLEAPVAAAPAAKAVVAEEEEEAAEANIFVDEYISTFNNKMKNKLNKLIEILKQSMQDDSDIANYLNSLYRDLHVLRGAAQAAELNLTENFLGLWESVVEHNMTKSSDVIKKWGVAGLPALEKGLLHLWNLREIVSKSKSESKITKMQDTMALHNEYVAVVKSLS